MAHKYSTITEYQQHMSGIIRQKIYYIEIVLEKLQKSGIMLCVLQTRGGVAEWSKAGDSKSS